MSFLSCRESPIAVCSVLTVCWYVVRQAEETAKKNEVLRAKAEARIAAALEANAASLQHRRAAFDEKQALTTQRSLCAPHAKPPALACSWTPLRQLLTDCTILMRKWSYTTEAI